MSAHPTIIVVEDDPTLGWMLTQALGQIAPGHPIYSCRDGLDALAYLMQHEVGCVITDYVMPAMDGITLAEIMNNKWPTIPVLLISGQPPETVQRQLKEQTTNFVMILEKPFSMDHLRAVLEPILEPHDQGDERQVMA